MAVVSRGQISPRLSSALSLFGVCISFLQLRSSLNEEDVVITPLRCRLQSSNTCIDFPPLNLSAF